MRGYFKWDQLSGTSCQNAASQAVVSVQTVWKQTVSTWGQGSPLGQPHRAATAPPGPPATTQGPEVVQEGRGFLLSSGCEKVVLPIPFRITAGLQAGAFPVPRLCEGLSRIHEKFSYFPQHTFFWQWVNRCVLYRWKMRGRGQQTITSIPVFQKAVDKSKSFQMQDKSFS